MQQTTDGNAVLVSMLDSTIRLMDKSNGKMLQHYKGHTNSDFRIRSCLGFGDAAIFSGSEDGKVYIWDVLEGKVLERLAAHEGKVASAVACNSVRKEFASAGIDGESLLSILLFNELTENAKGMSSFGACRSKQSSGKGFRRLLRPYEGLFWNERDVYLLVHIKQFS